MVIIQKVGLREKYNSGGGCRFQVELYHRVISLSIQMMNNS